MRRPILSRLAVPALVVLLSVSCSTDSFTVSSPDGNHDFTLFADKGGEPGAGIQPAVLKGTVTGVTMYPRGGFVMFYE